MEAIVALLALSLMEIVLGIDNIIFITILTQGLPEERQPIARRLGLVLALGTRLALLAAIKWIMGLTAPLFTLTQHLRIPQGWLEQVAGEHWEQVDVVSLRDVILLVGGLFLIGKSVVEIHERFHDHITNAPGRKARSFGNVLVQIAILDIVFSLDSVITAVGMAEQLWVMMSAVVIAVGVMILFAEPVSRFVKSNPTLSMLALSFLILIGVTLVADAVGTHINKGYIYFAMTFSLIVEMLNLRLHRRASANPAGRDFADDEASVGAAAGTGRGASARPEGHPSAEVDGEAK